MRRIGRDVTAVDDGGAGGAVTQHDGSCVGRAMRALELLASGPLSAPELAAALESHPRTVRRMLARLVDEEYLAPLGDARRRYALTMRLVAVAGQWLEHAELPRVAGPFVALLHARARMTAHLVVPSYDCVLCVVHCADAEVPEPRLRELVPAHCTAGGKALLAARRWWRESVLGRELTAHTAHTLTDPAALEQDALATRQRGFAIEEGEYRDGVRAVAAPVYDPTGTAIAAIGISTTGDLDVAAVGAEVISVAASLTAELGHGSRSSHRPRSLGLATEALAVGRQHHR